MTSSSHAGSKKGQRMSLAYIEMPTACRHHLVSKGHGYSAWFKAFTTTCTACILAISRHQPVPDWHQDWQVEIPYSNQTERRLRCFLLPSGTVCRHDGIVRYRSFFQEWLSHYANMSDTASCQGCCCCQAFSAAFFITLRWYSLYSHCSYACRSCSHCQGR